MPSSDLQTFRILGGYPGISLFEYIYKPCRTSNNVCQLFGRRSQHRRQAQNCRRATREISVSNGGLVPILSKMALVLHLCTGDMQKTYPVPNHFKPLTLCHDPKLDGNRLILGAASPIPAKHRRAVYISCGFIQNHPQIQWFILTTIIIIIIIIIITTIVGIF